VRARSQEGFCVWFTGLSGAGKSTTANALAALLENHGRTVTVLDGDVVRTHLSKDLGFSREDRDANVSRIGFVASEIVKHGGAVVCAAISPYRAARDGCRTLVGADRFVEVFVDTPLEICMARDPKKLYTRALRGEIKDLTGLDAPYEPPINPEVTLDSVTRTADENAEDIILYLMRRGWIEPVAVH
jgi:sulfate adenylyltransferase